MGQNQTSQMKSELSVTVWDFTYPTNMHQAREYKRHKAFSLPATVLPDGAADVGSSPAAETGRALRWSSGRLGERTPHLAHASSQGARCELPKTSLAAGVTVNFTDEGNQEL